MIPPWSQERYYVRWADLIIPTICAAGIGGEAKRSCVGLVRWRTLAVDMAKEASSFCICDT